MTTDIQMAYGSHHRIAQSVHDVRVNIISGHEVGPEVELVASILPDPMIPNPSHLPATSVAIHTDRSAAMILFSRLRETFLTMGSPGVTTSDYRKSALMWSAQFRAFPRRAFSPPERLYGLQRPLTE